MSLGSSVLGEEAVVGSALEELPGAKSKSKPSAAVVVAGAGSPPKKVIPPLPIPYWAVFDHFVFGYFGPSVCPSDCP